jgi:S-adenosylmethionine:tRNA-ribosyltransferase-isomerase (queuine synthetase)
VQPGAGWTDLVIGPGRRVRAVSGLVSGLHEPEASHLLLLEAVAGPAMVAAAYEEAVAGRYLWHEFGDSMLFLPSLSTEADPSRAAPRGAATVDHQSSQAEPTPGSA